MQVFFVFFGYVVGTVWDVTGRSLQRMSLGIILFMMCNLTVFSIPNVTHSLALMFETFSFWWSNDAQKSQDVGKTVELSSVLS